MERSTLKSNVIAVLALSCSIFAGRLGADVQGLPGASDNPYMNRHVKSAVVDQSALRDAVDETQALLDGLAHETRRLPKKDLEPLFVSLRDEYHLPDYVGKARKFTEEAEMVLAVQDAIKAQQAYMRAHPSAIDDDRDSNKLRGLQNDLVAAVNELRETLAQVQQQADEDATRDLHNWIMISEGLLRGRREDAEAKALSPSAGARGSSPAAETVLSAAGISPPAGVQGQGLTPVAAAGSPAPGSGH
jgi:hypothetical protein